jgi:serine kinase of HPr protein (carbohydrate metabolism regulator)
MTAGLADCLLVHGTTVAVDGAAVLLRGAPGSGKSDLALRLLDRGALLVADDQTRLVRRGEAVVASAPETIAGRIEVRGVGILAVPSVAEAPLRLVVDLVAADRGERLPEPRTVRLLGLEIPLLSVAPFEASAAVKLRYALGALAQNHPFG